MFVKKSIIIAFLFSTIYSLKNVTIKKKRKKFHYLIQHQKKYYLSQMYLKLMYLTIYFSEYIKKKKNYHIHFSIIVYVQILNQNIYNLAEKVSIEPNKVSGTTLKFKIKKDRFLSIIGVIITSDNYITETIQ